MCISSVVPVSVKMLFPYARSVCLYGLADVLVMCSSLLSVGSFALIMSRSSICALMFSGSRGLLGLILPLGCNVCQRQVRVVLVFCLICVRLLRQLCLSVRFLCCW